MCHAAQLSDAVCSALLQCAATPGGSRADRTTVGFVWLLAFVSHRTKNPLCTSWVKSSNMRLLSSFTVLWRRRWLAGIMVRYLTKQNKAQNQCWFETADEIWSRRCYTRTSRDPWGIMLIQAVCDVAEVVPALLSWRRPQNAPYTKTLCGWRGSDQTQTAGRGRIFKQDRPLLLALPQHVVCDVP